MLIEHTLFGDINKVEKAMERLRMFEPEEGYHLAFSGVKDSLCIYYLALDSGVKFTPYYNHTTVDPPELIHFIREYFPDIIVKYPKETMWQLIVRHKTPPTRLMRYCCADLKENNTMDEKVSITGVRWAESVRRRKKRGIIELNAYSSRHIVLHNDNEEARMMFETCAVKGRHIVNPIIDWSNEDVWEYISLRQIPYCSLYDCGFKRLGCIGCPFSGFKQMKWELERYPKYKQAYVRTFDRMIQARVDAGLHPVWKDGKEVLSWWVGDKRMESENQLVLQEILENDRESIWVSLNKS